jgi:hypothetical protein
MGIHLRHMPWLVGKGSGLAKWVEINRPAGSINMV